MRKQTSKPIRLLPILMAFSTVLLGAKVVDMVLGSGFFTEEFIVSELHAKPAESKENKGEEAAKESSRPKTETQPKAQEKNIIPPESVAKSNTQATGDAVQLADNPIDMKLLESLSERRKQLDERERNLVLKEGLLANTEDRVESRINSLEKLKAEVEDLLKQYNEKEKTKVKGLVKIYENMKPKDAARIFDEMEMPILLQVVDQMKEAKVAPILAKMSPQRAKVLTVELAGQRKLSETIPQ